MKHIHLQLLEKRYNTDSQVELYIYSQHGINMLKYNSSEQEVLYKKKF